MGIITGGEYLKACEIVERYKCQNKGTIQVTLTYEAQVTVTVQVPKEWDVETIMDELNDGYYSFERDGGPDVKLGGITEIIVDGEEVVVVGNKTEIDEVIEKPIPQRFKEGDWLYWESDISKLIGKYQGLNPSNGVITDEYYQVNNNDGWLMGFGGADNLFGVSEARLATDSEIEDVLISVAKFKGLVHGVSYCYPERPSITKRKLKYPLRYHGVVKGVQSYQLYDSKGNVIYDSTGWAEPIVNNKLKTK